MYKSLIRPLLFALSPETVHHLVVAVLKVAFKIPGAYALSKLIFGKASEASPVELFGIRFPNRIGLAAGFDKKADIYNPMSAFGFGHIEVGTVNPLPQPGNPKPRLFRLPKDNALINRMGFNNPGVETFVANIRKQKPRVIIGGNIGKNTLTPNEQAVNDYLVCFEKLYPWVDYFVINVSCPNVANLGKLQNKSELLSIVKAINTSRQSMEIRKPVLLKIAPDLTHGELDDVLDVVQSESLDGIIATNTSTGRTGLLTTKSQIDTIGKGGLSGLPLRDVSTETIRYLSQKSLGMIPIIGVGGIMSFNDAIEKLEAGAKLIQIYTGFIYEGPFFVQKINKAVESYLKNK